MDTFPHSAPAAAPLSAASSALDRELALRLAGQKARALGAALAGERHPDTRTELHRIQTLTARIDRMIEDALDEDRRQEEAR